MRYTQRLLPAAGQATVVSPLVSLARNYNVEQLTKELVDRKQPKCLFRLFLEGGPIIQPEFFVLQPEESSFPIGVRRQNKTTYLDFVPKQRLWRFKEVVARSLQRSEQIKLVFKPNCSALGKGIFFFEINPKDKSSSVTLSKTPYIEDQRLVAVERIFAAKDGCQVVENEQRHTLKIKFSPRTFQELVLNLFELWQIYSLEENRLGQFRFDPGLVEQKVEALCFDSRAYETRHTVVGLLNGSAQVKEGRNIAFARLGSSSYFSNYYGRDSQAKCLPSSMMFEPLFNLYRFDSKKQKEFKDHIDRLLLREFAYLMARIRSAGIKVRTNLSLQIDLMWVPPHHDSSDCFPQPIIVEANMVREVSRGWRNLLI